MAQFHIPFSVMLARFLLLVVFSYVCYYSFAGNCFSFSTPYAFCMQNRINNIYVRPKDTEVDENWAGGSSFI